MRCSTTRIRAASVSGVSLSQTATAPCITIGPASVSGMTKCTVAASMSAAMFDPRPEIRIATRRFMASPRQVEVTVIDHAMIAGSRDHFAQQRHALAALSQNVRDLIEGVLLHDRNHADAAVES